MNEEEWKTVYDVQIYVTSLSAISCLLYTSDAADEL